MALSYPEEFFDRLRDHKDSAFPDLCALVERREDENQWRDFKDAAWLLSDTSSTEFSAVLKTRDNRDKLRRTWSENVGAFANSGGGILIWGIKASKRKAESPSLAPDAEGLADWLTEQQANATDPSVQGVRVLPVFERQDSRSGFVVCLIPSSRLAPHRSIWAERDYYGRFDDGNRALPTEILRRMFYPQVSAFLVPRASFQIASANGRASVHCSISLKNEGLASAVNTVVDVEGVFWGTATGIWTSHNWKTAHPGLPNRLVTESVIHPGDTIQLASLAMNEGRPEMGDLSIEFQIFSANSPPLHGRIFIPANDCVPTPVPIERVATMHDFESTRF